MKNYFFAFAFISLALTSCYQNDEVISVNEKIVSFSLNASGVQQSSLTRAIDEPTNLLIIDKLGEEVTTEVKNSLGSFDLPLEYGNHDIYFVAATTIWSEYSTSDLTVTWPNTHAGLSYVWAYHLSLTVDENTTVNEITLPMVMASVKLSTLDKVSANVKNVKVDAPDFCRGLDLKTMNGFVIDTPVNYTLDVSATAGTRVISINMFTFVPESNSIGDMVISFLDSDSKEVASKTFEDVPVQKGYISQYSGYFFSGGVSIPLSYTDDWTGTNTYSY